MKENSVYLHGVYERIWHWIQALLIIVLIFTSVGIHWPGFLPAWVFTDAINIHNIAGFVLIGNALLGLFYHLTTGEIRQFVPEPKDFVSTLIAQIRFYAGGIFKNEEHPFERSPTAKLNPLQKVTYLGILNILLPTQMITGLLIWGAQRWPGTIAWLGGLGMLAKIHTFAAWMFVAFLIVHVYMTTTGETPLTLVKAMITGYETKEQEQPHGQDGQTMPAGR